MPTAPEKPATTPIPVQLSASEFTQFILPHLSMPKRGPKCKLGYHRVFNLILWVLYTGMQWKCLPVPTDTHGKPAIHYTTVYKVFARWSDDGSLEQAFIASVAHLADHHQLDLSILHGDGTNTVAKKGGDGIGYSGHKHQKGEKVIAIIDNNGYVLAPLPVAPVNEADTVLLPEGLKALKRVAKLTGLDAHRRVSQSRWRLRFHVESQGDLQCGDDSEHQGESTQSQDAQARAQAVVQCSDPCVTGARRADVCVGGQIQAVAAPFRAHPAAPLRDEIDGLHLDQFEAFLQCLKLATSYNFVLPHASLRQRLPCPEATSGRGAAKVWRPCPPAMAGGWTDHAWSLQEVLLSRVPPWP